MVLVRTYIERRIVLVQSYIERRIVLVQSYIERRIVLVQSYIEKFEDIKRGKQKPLIEEQIVW
jgi:hypothetical protein